MVMFRVLRLITRLLVAPKKDAGILAGHCHFVGSTSATPFQTPVCRLMITGSSFASLQASTLEISPEKKVSAGE